MIPVTLLAQWESEVGAKAPGLSLYSYYNDWTKNEILKEDRNFEDDDSLYCTEPDADDDEVGFDGFNITKALYAVEQTNDLLQCDDTHPSVAPLLV